MALPNMTPVEMNPKEINSETSSAYSVKSSSSLDKAFCGSFEFVTDWRILKTQEESFLLEKIESTDPVDFSVDQDGYGNTLLHMVFLVKSTERCRSILRAALERLCRPNSADKVKWVRKNADGLNIFTMAAERTMLHVVWGAVRALRYFTEEQACITIPVRAPIAEEDWDQIAVEDRHRFRLVCGTYSAASLELCLESNKEEPSLSRMSELILHQRADVCFQRGGYKFSALHKCVMQGNIDGLRVCLASENAIDFTLKVEGSTILHVICSRPAGDHHSGEMLRMVLNRLRRPGCMDTVDWLQENKERQTIFTLAAERKLLNVLWSEVRDFPFFSANQREKRICISSKVWDSDWEKMDAEAKKHFVLEKGTMMSLFSGPNALQSNATSMQSAFPFTSLLFQPSSGSSNQISAPSVSNNFFFNSQLLPSSLTPFNQCGTPYQHSCLAANMISDEAVKNAKPTENVVPLYMFTFDVERGDIKSVEAFLKGSYSIDFTDPGSNGSPFHALCALENIEVVETILTMILSHIKCHALDKVDWNIRDDEGEHWLSYAVRNCSGKLPLVWSLVKPHMPSNAAFFPIPLIHPVAVRDWEALGKDKIFFELLHGLQDGTYELYTMSDVSDETSRRKVRDILQRRRDLSLNVQMVYMSEPLLIRWIRYGLPDIVRYCMESNHAIDFTMQDSEGRTPFHLVCNAPKEARTTMLESMVAREAEKRESDMRQNWYSRSCIKDHHGLTVFSYAASRGCLNDVWRAVKQLVERVKGKYPITTVVDKADWDALGDEQVHFTLMKGVQKDSRDATDELYALGDNVRDEDQVRHWIEHGADVSCRKDYMVCSALHHAVRSWHAGSIVPICMSTQLPIDFTVTDEYGQTPLHYACGGTYRYHESEAVDPSVLGAMVQRITSHPEDKVNWDQEDILGNTILSHAARHRQLEVVIPIVRRVPLFSDRFDAECVRITVPMLREDWESVDAGDRKGILLTRPIRESAKSAAESFLEYKAEGEFSVKYLTAASLGEGAFGSVYRAELSDGSPIAIKKVRPTRDIRTLDKAEEEAILMQGLRHENIVTCYGYQTEGSASRWTVYMFLELCLHNLEELVRHNRAMFTMSVVRKYTRHILAGLQFLHEAGIVHRDVKPANVLVTEDGVAKLADFNVSKRLIHPVHTPAAVPDDGRPTPVEERTSKQIEDGDCAAGVLPQKPVLVNDEKEPCADGGDQGGENTTNDDDDDHDDDDDPRKRLRAIIGLMDDDFRVTSAKTEQVGTAGYRAPEVDGNHVKEYGVDVDIFSVGCTVLSLLGRGTVTAYSTQDSTDSSDRCHPGMPSRQSCPAALHTFLTRCLAREPKDRWRAKDLLEKDEWLNCSVDALEELSE